MRRADCWIVCAEHEGQVTDEQLKALQDKLAANRQPIKLADQYAHPRGWNDCLDFVERTIKEIVEQK